MHKAGFVNIVGNPNVDRYLQSADYSSPDYGDL